MTGTLSFLIDYNATLIFFEPRGSRGIGLELAKTTAALGSHVAILDVVEPEVSVQQLERLYGSNFTFHR